MKKIFLYLMVISGIIAATTSLTYANGSCTDETFEVTGNITIQALVGNSVFSGDAGNQINVIEVAGIAENVGAAIATNNSGSITLNADGNFTYDPPTGFIGEDSVTYAVEDDTESTQSCTMTFTISDMIWFIDSYAPADTGDGSLDNPFRDMTEFNNATSSVGDAIFIYDRGSVYRGVLTLLDSQIVVGQGASESLSLLTGINFAPLSFGLPETTANASHRAQMTNPDGAGIIVASDNRIYGVEVRNTNDYGIKDNGNSVGILSINETSIIGSGAILSLTNGGILAATFDDLITNSSAAGGIILDGIGGTLSANRTTISGITETGIQIDNSLPDAIFDFGTLNITSTHSIALSGTNNADAIIQSMTCGALRTTGFALIDLDNTALNVTCSSLNAANANGDGINLEAVSGELTVINSSTLTLTQATTGTGIHISNSTFLGSFGTTTITHFGTGDAVILDSNTSDFLFDKLALTAAHGNAFYSRNHNGTLTATSTASSLLATEGACADIEGATTQLNMLISVCRTTNSIEHAINLVGTSGVLFRIAGGVTIDMQENSSEPIFIQDVTTSNIDIGTNGTTMNNVSISQRNSDAIYINNFAGDESHFGNVTINAAIVEGVSGNGITFMESSGNVIFNFLALDMSNGVQTIPEMASDIAEDLPNNSYNDGNGLLVINNTGSFTVAFGGTISNVPDDGIFAHSSEGIQINELRFGTTGGHNVFSLNMRGDSLYDTVTFNNYLAGQHGVYIAHYLTVDSSYTFTNSIWLANNQSAQSGFLLETRHSESHINLTINETWANGCRFEDNNTALNILAGNTSDDSSQLNTLIEGCRFSNSGQISLTVNNNASHNIQFLNNEIVSNVDLDLINFGILALLARSNGILHATVDGNIITGTSGSRFHGIGVIVFSSKTLEGDVNVAISNNRIDSTEHGMFIRLAGQSDNSDFEITNNRIGANRSIRITGIRIETDTTERLTTHHRFLIENNRIGFTGVEGMRIEVRGKIELYLTVNNNNFYAGNDAFELNTFAETFTCLDLHDNTVFQARTASYDIDSREGAIIMLEGAGDSIVTGFHILETNRDFDGSGVDLGALIHYNENTDCDMPSGSYQ